MNERTIFDMLRLPARIGVREASQLLGFQEYHIPILVKQRMLKPLGDPVQNAPKFFATTQILAAAQDPEWLSKATRAVSRCRRARHEMEKPGRKVTLQSQLSASCANRE